MITTTQNRATTSKAMALGLLLAALMAAFMLLAAGQARASTTFTVNSTADNADALLTGGVCDTGYKIPDPGGAMVAECTLRAAIQQANYTTGADVINFAIPGNGVKTIAVGSSDLGSLPTITKPVSINGYSQPGASPNTKAVGSDAVLKVELSAAAVPDGNGLVIEASNSTVRGLVVNRAGNSGIFIGPGATGNRIAGNYIGTDDTGTKALGNNTGVYIYGALNTVGGATAGERNVISGNNSEGVIIYGTGATGNKVTGNYIGTDKSGTKALGNTDQGVYIGFAADNTVGGTSAGERNIISANGDSGMLIGGSEARGNRVLGNFIGTDRGGVAPLGNGHTGVSISLAPSNTIGGTTAGARNVISANAIDGVAVYGDTATGNRILSNSIFANVDAGIDLGEVGPTANDPGDTDTGANYLQNFPVLSSARKSATGTTTVRSKLNSTPDKTFKVQFFSNPSGTDEGKTLLGSATVSTDGSGNVSFTFSTKKAIRLGQNITATATGPGGNTSEFSAPRKVVAP